MPSEDEMTINERRKYLKRMKPLYLKANKSQRGHFLDQMQEVTGLHRKSLLRRLACPQSGAPATVQATPAELLTGGGAGDCAGVGKSGPYLCRAADSGVAGYSSAPATLWSSTRLSPPARATSNH